MAYAPIMLKLCSFIGRTSQGLSEYIFTLLLK